MNTIVDKLLDVDREARKILDEAQQYYETTIAETKDEKKRIKARYTEKANKHISDAEKADRAEAEERISAIRTYDQALAAEMEQTYEQYHKQWQEDLFARCVTGV